jgi:NitT/TauT family transport system ATP-binding protein
VGRVFDNDVTALDSINLDIPQGQFLAILGPSGCGKSTLLRLIAGLDRPQSGTIGVGSDDGPRVAIHGKPELAYVFQDAHLLPWRSVLDNVALPLELMHVSRSDRHEASRAAIEKVGLAETIDRFPSQLSGGQRMRVSLARAVVTRPKLLLLDEPFAALDEITRQKLDEQLRRLWLDDAMTVLFVTHSTTEAAYLAERAVVMSPRPGHIIADRPIELPADRPASIRGSGEFARETRWIYSALEGGGK